MRRRTVAGVPHRRAGDPVGGHQRGNGDAHHRHVGGPDVGGVAVGVSGKGLEGYLPGNGLLASLGLDPLQEICEGKGQSLNLLDRVLRRLERRRIATALVHDPVPGHVAVVDLELAVGDRHRRHEAADRREERVVHLQRRERLAACPVLLRAFCGLRFCGLRFWAAFLATFASSSMSSHW